MKIRPEIGSVSIVLLGALNPKIITPEWFLRNDLIDEEQCKNADVQIIHREVTVFATDWFDLKVETLSNTGRFIITTKQEPYIRVFDLVMKTFGEILIHTPLGMLGINREVHYALPDAATRNEIGKKLAPREPWGEWGKQIQEGDGVLSRNGGLRSLTMEDRNLDDRNNGYIRALIEPSEIVKFGIFVRVNDHYQLNEPDKVVGCNEIIDILNNNFEESLKRSDWIINQIMELT